MALQSANKSKTKAKVSESKVDKPQAKTRVSTPSLPEKREEPVVTYSTPYSPLISQAEQSDQIDKLAGALVKAQMEMDAASKDSENPYYKSMYADYSSVRAAAFPALNKHGLCVVQTFDDSEMDSIKLVTTLIHISGQWIKGAITLPVARKSDPQACGSACTYARRYALAAITGIAQQDDDAESTKR